MVSCVKYRRLAGRAGSLFLLSETDKRAIYCTRMSDSHRNNLLEEAVENLCFCVMIFSTNNVYMYLKATGCIIVAY